MILLTLLACATEKPYEPTQVCDEIRWSLDARVLDCTGDGAAASAFDDALEAEVPCGVVSFADGALTTASGRVVPLDDAYRCPMAVESLPCGEPDPLATWEALVAQEPRCDGLREPPALPVLDDCTPTPEGNLVCLDPLPWAEARDACVSGRRALWDTWPDELQATLEPTPGRYWLGLSMQVCGDPVACETMWFWESGDSLFAPDSAPWDVGEPDPITVGTAVSFSVAPGFGMAWQAEDPSVALPFVCGPTTVPP